jgi:hypothetical protein
VTRVDPREYNPVLWKVHCFVMRLVPPFRDSGLREGARRSGSHGGSRSGNGSVYGGKEVMRWAEGIN